MSQHDFATSTKKSSMTTTTLTPQFAIVDSHVHLINPALLQYSWLSDETPGQLKKTFTEEDYRKCSHLSDIIFVEVDAKDSEGDEHLLAEAKWVQEIPGVRGMICNAPLEKGGAYTEKFLARIKSITSTKLVGIRRLLQKATTKDVGTDKPFFLIKDFIAGLKVVVDAGLVFDICAYQSQLSDVVKMISLAEEKIVGYEEKSEEKIVGHEEKSEGKKTGSYVLDHMGKPEVGSKFAEWCLNIQLLSAFPGVSCKLSPGFLKSRPAFPFRELYPYVEHVIKCFGYERILFGTDWFFSNEAVSPQEWYTLVLEMLTLARATDQQKRQVFSENALRIYGL